MILQAGLIFSQMNPRCIQVHRADPAQHRTKDKELAVRTLLA
jgi:hypothetical protein